MITFAIGGGISLVAQAQEILGCNVEAASSSTLGSILAPEASCGDRDIEVDPDPVLGNLVVGRRHPQTFPVNSGVT